VGSEEPKTKKTKVEKSRIIRDLRMKEILVGGFNPFEKILVKMGILPK